MTRQTNDKELRFMISGNIITESQLAEMLETEEGREEVEISIEAARVFFATTGVTQMLDTLGVTLNQDQTKRMFDIICGVCFGADNEEILALMSQTVDTFETVIKKHNILNYDC